MYAIQLHKFEDLKFILSLLVDYVSRQETEDPNVFVFITHLIPPSSGQWGAF